MILTSSTVFAQGGSGGANPLLETKQEKQSKQDKKECKKDCDKPNPNYMPRRG